MFKKLLKEIMAAKTYEEAVKVLYREDGVDRLYQKEKIKWDEHEILFDLVAKLFPAR